MGNSKIYFKNINFLRFLFCLCIVLTHISNALCGNVEIEQSVPLYHHIVNNSKFNTIPVDCFFILSGFFLFNTTNFNENFYEFAKKKIIRLLPVVLFAIILWHIVSSVVLHHGVPFNHELWAVLMLQNIGLTTFSPLLGNIWFVSTLFWVSGFYFYLFKIIDRKWFNLITAGLVFAGYALYLHTGDHKPFENIYYVLNYGTIRGLAGIGLGYFIWQLFNDHLKNIRCNKTSIINKLIYTGLELIFILAIFKNIVFKAMSYDNKLLLILDFALLFILFIVKKGFISQLLENNISVFLGQFSYSIYITHIIFRNIWQKHFFEHHKKLVINYPELNILIIFVCSILFGIFTYYYIEKPATKLLKKKFITQTK